jgi:predicted DNA-binding protein
MVKKIPTMVYVDPEDMTKLEDMSRETGRSISTIIREAVKMYLKEVESVYSVAKGLAKAVEKEMGKEKEERKV